ncbi:MAG: hypothetical protein Q9204_001776 [Flavoplaca sp. TL-2023a]
MLGLSERQTADAISQAWVDGQSLRTYRHSPNTMSRKSWAAGDACQRAVNLVLKVQRGEHGVPTVLSAPVWGFYDVLFKGKKFEFQRPYGSYVMENILFKVSYPAEFHSQTAVEAAKLIHADLKEQGKSVEDIESVTIRTHEACRRIIDKQHKPMDNFADRDHCIQYMVATMLVFNRLHATDYTDGSEAATSPLVESLRTRISCIEDPLFTKSYHDPSTRSIPNALTVKLKDGNTLQETVIEAPLGHRLRREEAKPEILKKYERHLQGHFDQERITELMKLGQDRKKLESMGVDRYMDLYVKEKMDWLTTKTRQGILCLVSNILHTDHEQLEMEVNRTHEMINGYPVDTPTVKRNPCLAENHGLSGKLDITPSLMWLIDVLTERHKLGSCFGGDVSASDIKIELDKWPVVMGFGKSFGVVTRLVCKTLQDTCFGPSHRSTAHGHEIVTAVTDLRDANAIPQVIKELLLSDLEIMQ